MTKKTENFIDNTKSLEQMIEEDNEISYELSARGMSSIEIYQSYWLQGQVNFINENMRKSVKVDFYTFIAMEQRHNNVIVKAYGWRFADKFYLKLNGYPEPHSFEYETEAIDWLKAYAKAYYLEHETLL